MYENTFKRFEQKYVITKEKMHKVLKRIEPYIEHDKYFESEILNIYFDNSYNDLIIRSLEKPPYKLKVRVRSYGVPKDDDDIFFELKTKYNKMVGKRRVKLSLKEFDDYINNNIFDSGNQIMREIDYFMKLYNLKPSIFISYKRLSYKVKQSTYLRITFDTDLKSRRNNLKLLYDSKDMVYKENLVIVEVKTLGSLPKWFVDVFSELNIYPTSFSKYGQIYTLEKLKESV